MKKYFFTVFVFILSLSHFSYAAIPSDWKLIDSVGVDEAYQSITSSTSVMTVVKKEDNNQFKLKEFNLENYVKALPMTRSLIHKLVGIKNWEITESEKSEYFNGTTRVLLVKLKGKYWRDEKTEVEFVEWHHFYGNTFLQLQLIRNKEMQTKDDLALFKELQGKWL